MPFPAYIPLGPFSLHPHPVFETLAYFVGFRLYLAQRRRQGDRLDEPMRWRMVAAAIVGAALGAKLLAALVDPALLAAHWQEPGFWLFGGKTIVGGLVGGLVAVEGTKRWLGVTRSTGDLYALPLAVGIGLGRIGCFLTGLSDRTYGLPTALPWGVDFGDGIPRHPTQLYEAVFLLALAGWLAWRGRRPHGEGSLFRTMLGSYLALRLAIEFLKPGWPLGGLTAIQWACVAVLAHYAWSSRYRRATPEAISTAV